MKAQLIFRYKNVWIIAALVAAALIRLILLDHTTLSNEEASLALQALNLSRGEAVQIGPQSGYVLITSLFFGLFGATTFLARLVPALAGIIMVTVPFLYEDILGLFPAVILSFAFALDPGLVSLSRQAGGPMLAVSFGLLAGGLWMKRKPGLAGISAALALMGGPALWSGLLSLGAAVFFTGVPRLSALLREVGLTGAAGTDAAGELSPHRAPGYLRRFLVTAGVTLFGVGTLLFTHPNGLSATVSSLPAYITRWTAFSVNAELPILPWLLILVVYHPVPLLLGVWGSVRGLIKKETLSIFLVEWALAALLLGLCNPSRQAADVICAVVPLWIMAAREGIRLFNLDGEYLLPIAGQIVMTFIISVFGWLSLTNLLLNQAQILPGEGYRWLVLLGALLLILFTAYLVAWAWSPGIAGKGMVCGAFLALAVYTLSATTSAGGLRPTPKAELYRPSSQPAQTGLLASTIGDFSEWNTGDRTQIDVTISGIDDASLRWLLRDYPNAVFTNYTSADSQPSMVVTLGDTDQPALAASYRGQRFTISETSDWSQDTLLDWMDWLVYRKTVTANVHAILWVRTDLFAGGVSSTGQ